LAIATRKVGPPVSRIGPALQPELSDYSDILPVAGGDKPRHYKRNFTEQVGAGFIPARESVCIEQGYPAKNRSV